MKKTFEKYEDIIKKNFSWRIDRRHFELNPR